MKENDTMEDIAFCLLLGAFGSFAVHLITTTIRAPFQIARFLLISIR